MKNVLKIIGVISLLLFSSCRKNLEKRISGDWDYTSLSTIVTTGTDSYSEESKDYGRVIFNDDGTGTMISDVVGETVKFNWVSENKEIFEMVGLDSLGSPMDTIHWKVVENKRKAQTWEYTNRFSESDEDAEVTVEMNTQLILTKVSN